MMAEQIVRMITHPEQIIQKKGEIMKFIILQKGDVGYCAKSQNSIIDGACLQKLHIKKDMPARLLSLDFLKGKMLKYNVKSLSYCILYYFAH
jgi:hypothetical protein